MKIHSMTSMGASQKVQMLPWELIGSLFLEDLLQSMFTTGCKKGQIIEGRYYRKQGLDSTFKKFI